MSGRTRRRFLQAAGVAGLAGLAGCGGGGGGAGNGGNQIQLTWLVAAGNPLYERIGTELTALVEANTGFGTLLETSESVGDVVALLTGNNAEYAILPADVAAFARNGLVIEAFRGSAAESLRGVMALFPESLSIVARADGEVETLADLEGQRVVAAGGTEALRANVERLLDAAGVAVGSLDTASLDDGTAAVADGEAAAVVTVGAWPQAALTDLAAETDIRLLPVTGETRESLLGNTPWLVADTIPAGVYEGVDRATRTVARNVVVVTTTARERAEVRRLVIRLFDNLGSVGTRASELSRERAMGAMGIQPHEGAASAYRQY
jgi:TRAP transporter TAXI family solute receptor